MSILKYRVWDVGAKKYFNSSVRNHDYLKSFVSIVDQSDFGQASFFFESSDLSELEFEPFIGLQDSEGTDIYQGDILEHCIVPYFGAKESYIRKVVVYNATEAKFEAEDYDIPLSEIDDWKIVGNILENKNLLDD